MELLEFTQRLFKMLEPEGKREVIKKAAQQNFRVQGFKNSSLAPIHMVLKAMERPGKDGKPGAIIMLEAICTVYQLDGKVQEEAALAAAEWLCGEEEAHARAIEKLLKIEKNTEDGKKKEPQTIAENRNKSTEIPEKEEEKQPSQEQQDLLKNKIKKLQTTIQNLRIQSEDQEKQYLQLKKEKDRLQRKIEEEQQKFEQLQKENDTLKQTIQEQKEQILQLQKQEELLVEYKKRTPKILCFSKTSFEKSEYPFYNITWIENWGEDTALTIDWKSYSEVWIITKDFSYYACMEISKYAVGRISKFLSLKRLKNKLEERAKNEFI